MPRNIDHDGIGFGSQLAFSTAVSDSTREGTLMVLDAPLSNWAVSSLLEQSTEATLVLRGAATTDSEAFLSTILSVTASTSTAGKTNWSTAAFAAKQVRLDVDAVSSSGAITAFIAGAP